GLRGRDGGHPAGDHRARRARGGAGRAARVGAHRPRARLREEHPPLAGGHPAAAGDDGDRLARPGLALQQGLRRRDAGPPGRRAAARHAGHHGGLRVAGRAGLPGAPGGGDPAGAGHGRLDPRHPAARGRPARAGLTRRHSGRCGSSAVPPLRTWDSARIFMTSSTSSVTWISSGSARDALPSETTACRSQSSRPLQYALPKSTTGKRVTLRVCTRVSASNSSSRVPKPPGSTTKPCEYFTNIVLRTKKYRKFSPRSTYSLRPCSKGSSMPRPTEVPPASCAPRLAASIAPGPPPVITAQPASTRARPMRTPAAYSQESGAVLAEP